MKDLRKKQKKCPKYVKERILSDVKNFLYENSDFEIGDIEHLKIEDY